MAPGALHGPNPLAAVVAHAGHDHGEDVAAVVRGHGPEEHVNGGPAAVLGRVLVEADDGLVPLPGTPQDHVPSAGRDVDLAGKHRLALDGLVHGQPGVPVQVLGQGGREEGRHVLHDEHGHAQVRRQGGDQLAQGVGAAGGDADAQHREPGGAGRLAAGRGRRGRRGRSRGRGHLRRGHGGRRGRDAKVGTGLHVAHDGPEDVPQFGAAGFGVGPLGLVHELQRPKGQGLHGVGRRGRGGAADHDHARGGVVGPDEAQGLESVQVGHLHVQEHQVDGGLVQAVEGELPAGAGRDLAVDQEGLHDLREDAAVDRRIVNDEDPEPGGGHRPSLSCCGSRCPRRGRPGRRGRRRSGGSPRRW